MIVRSIGMSILVFFGGVLSSAPAARLAITVVDDSDQPLRGRVLVRPIGGECMVPGGAVDLVIGPDRWFYSDGRLQLDVPAGRVELRVERGLEYKRIKQTLVVPETGLEQMLRLERWIDMRKLGYRCGENHLHVDCRRLGPMLVGEGPAFGSSLTWWNGPDRRRPIPPGNGHVRYLEFAGRRVPVSVYDAELEHAWGACYLTGATKPLALPSEAGRPNLDYIRQAVAAGAIAHYQAGWSREVLLDALLGFVHTVNVCNNDFHQHRFQPRSRYSNLLDVDGFPVYPDTPTGMMQMNTETCYRLLNCGLRLAGGAGSATGVKQVPARYNRAYVRCETDNLKAFYKSWAAGRNFVTNGAVVLLRGAGGEAPGDQVALSAAGGRLRFSIQVLSDCPLTGIVLVTSALALAAARDSDCGTVAADRASRHAVPREHPRLLGSRERLQRLAHERPDAYRRVVQVARERQADAHSKMISLALVCAIERDRELGQKAVAMAMNLINGPIKKGHTPFGHDLARCAIVYDLRHEWWSDEDRRRFHDYMNRTVDANVRSETHVFHNGWYGYKKWGIGLACYATYYENPRAESILRRLEEEYRTRAAPALQLAGAGGGWAEGYYIHYWLYEWLFFSEAARWCEGVDYYAAAPEFYRNGAVASMFETYPGISAYGSRRPIPMGNGGGRVFGGDRGKILSARRILVKEL